MKKIFAWPKKGNRAEVAKVETTTILGAVSPLGVINVEVKKLKSIKVDDVLKELLLPLRLLYLSFFLYFYYSAF